MNKRELEHTLDSFFIRRYHIHDNFVVDVNDNVNLKDCQLTKLPCQFGRVSGYFNCSENFLTSLQGCPSSVGGDFRCSMNMPLKSLQFCPPVVGQNFYCYCSQLTSLQYCPPTIVGNFSCFSNKLTSLEYCPDYVGRNFVCSDNHLTTLDHCPSVVGETFMCERNPLIINEDNEHVWMQLISKHRAIYSCLQEPTEKLMNFYKMIWEI